MLFLLLLPALGHRALGAGLVSLALLACTSSSNAQHKPYAPLAVVLDRPTEADPALHILIERLRAAIAEKNLATIDAMLAPGLVTYECDADPTKFCPPLATPAAAPVVPTNVKITGLAKPVRVAKAGPTKPDARLLALAKLAPPQRLRMGLCCRDVPVQHVTKEMREEAVLGVVGAALEEEGTPGIHPDLPGSACLPAWPLFDRDKALQLALDADVEPVNLRVSTGELVLRDKPAQDAPEVARIAPGQVVAFVTDAVDSLPDGWNSIALPQGGLGFTDQGGMADLTPAGLCFARDAAGAWKISVVVQRHS